MMLKIVNKTGSQKIDDAIKIFNSSVKGILDQVYCLPEKSYFTYTNDTNKQIVRKCNHFLAQGKTIEIRPYKTRWPWSSVIGYTYKGQYFINTRKIDSLSVSIYVGNIFHEILGHEVGYGHGSNRITEKKKKSWPYFVGYLASGETKITELS